MVVFKIGTNFAAVLQLVLLAAAIAVDGAEVADRSELAAARFVAELEPKLLEYRNIDSELAWTYELNFTKEAQDLRSEGQTNRAKFLKEVANELRQYDYGTFKDADLQRRIKKLTKLGYYALDEDKYNQLKGAIVQMKKYYDTVKVCQYRNETNCNVSLHPELSETFANSRDPEELKYYWVQWHDAIGKTLRKDLDKYVQLTQEAAHLNNFTSGAEFWLSAYEDDTFEAQIDAAIEQIRPLYEQLHAYVRHKLRMYYGSDLVSEKGPIPIHLLGTKFGEKWSNIAPLVTPFPNMTKVNITDEMVRQGYTVKKMFDMGDEFYQSINLTKLPPTFWEKSIFEKPKNDSEFVCSTRMWDFYKTDDVRIRKCTTVTKRDFFLVHHELAFIQYYLQYQHLPSMYREAPNPGFFEAFGGTITLSFNSPKHLAKIGLLKDAVLDKEGRLAQDFRTALTKLAFLPAAYTVDKHRWRIFRGEIKPEEYNCKYWEIRSRYAGVVPPVARSEDNFDAAAKYHVAVNIEYVRHFVSNIVQFQFHRAVCEKAGEYVKGDPEKTLNNCDIYQSAAAGNVLKEMLAMGASKPWPDAMEALTGQRKMNADAFIEYFQPLHEFLVAENKRLGAHVGWESNFKCKPS